MAWEGGDHRDQVARQRAVDAAHARMLAAEKVFKTSVSSYIWVPIALATGLLGLTTAVAISYGVLCFTLWFYKEYRKDVYDKAVEDNRFN